MFYTYTRITCGVHDLELFVIHAYSENRYNILVQVLRQFLQYAQVARKKGPIMRHDGGI